MCVHVRDGAGKHILMDLKGDGVLILRQNVNGRNVTVFGSAIDGNQLNVFRAFIFKDLNVTCLSTRTEVQVRIAAGRHSCSDGAHRGRGRRRGCGRGCWTMTWSCRRRRRWAVAWRRRLYGWGNRYCICSRECDGRSGDYTAVHSRSCTQYDMFSGQNRAVKINTGSGGEISFASP
jgi:hypothetical protein